MEIHSDWIGTRSACGLPTTPASPAKWLAALREDVGRDLIRTVDAQEPDLGLSPTGYPSRSLALKLPPDRLLLE